MSKPFCFAVAWTASEEKGTAGNKKAAENEVIGSKKRECRKRISEKGCLWQGQITGKRLSEAEADKRRRNRKEVSKWIH